MQWAEDPECRCAECKFPPSKRPRLRRQRASAPPEASEAVPGLSLQPSIPPQHEPIFVLERLAHIRSLVLTACGAGGRPLLDAAVTVRGSEVELQCVQLTEEGVDHVACLQLDVGEEVDSSSSTLQLLGGFAYVRLPLGPLPPSPHDADEAREASQLRGEVGLTCRAADQRRRERAQLRGARLRCRGCALSICRLQGDVRAMPDADAAAMVDFIQCCQVSVSCAGGRRQLECLHPWQCLLILLAAHEYVAQKPAPCSHEACPLRRSSNLNGSASSRPCL